MPLNIDREELIEKGQVVADDLSEMSGELQEILDEVQETLDNEEPRNRFGVAKSLNELATKIDAARGALRGLASLYAKNKKGLLVPERKPITAPKPASGERLYKLSSSIRSRTYDFGNGGTVVVPSPRFLVVKRDGSRELTTADGNRFHVEKGYARFFDTK